MTTQTEALKLALEAITQYLAESPDPSEEAVEGLCDAASVARKALAQPEQEPVAWMAERDGRYRSVDETDWGAFPVYTTPPQRKSQFKGFIQWANAQGYDCSQTYNSDTSEWIVLNPMTADLWKAWQAAHGIKE